MIFGEVTSQDVLAVIGVIGGGITIIGGACVGVYYLFRQKKTAADQQDLTARRQSDEASIKTRRESDEASIRARREADEVDHANESYNLDVIRGLYRELQDEFRMARKEHQALEKSVLKMQLESNAALSKCHQEHALVSERLRVSEAEIVDLRAENKSLEARLEAVEGRG